MNYVRIALNLRSLSIKKLLYNKNNIFIILDMDSIITRSLKNKVKKRKSPKNNSLKNEYSEFLKKGKNVPDPPKKVNKVSPKKNINITENRKNPIFIKTNNKKPSPKKSKPIQKKPIPKKPEPTKPEPKKQDPKKPFQKKPTPKRPVTRKKNIVSLKSKRRFSKKSKRRKLDKKHTKSRKISFRCYPQKEKNIGDVMKKANKVSDDEMKKELLSNGIEIKGTKNKLLKDIYMFSLLGGIKIHKE